MARMSKASAKRYNAATKQERHAALRERENYPEEIKPPHDKHADKQGDAENGDDTKSTDNDDNDESENGDNDGKE